MSADYSLSPDMESIQRAGVAVADIIDGKVVMRPEHMRFKIQARKFWKELNADAQLPSERLHIPGPQDTVTEAGFVKFDGDPSSTIKPRLIVAQGEAVSDFVRGIPPAPEQDPAMGSKTPAYAEWMRKYHPAKWATMHPDWAKKDYVELPEKLGPLERDKLEPDRFAYLSREDSRLYVRVYGSAAEKDIIIQEMIEARAASSRANHCRETY